MEARFEGEPMGRLDLRRSVSVLGWAIGYLGFAQYHIYLRAVDPLFPAQCFGPSLTPLLKSVACNLVVTPFINVPLYYLWSTTRLPWEQMDLSASVQTLKREWASSSLSGIALWGPAQWFNFACLPSSMRIPFMSGVAFVWSLVISLQAQCSNVHPRLGSH